MPTLDKELQELVAELQPTPEERQRQQVSFLHPLLHTLRFGLLHRDICALMWCFASYTCTLTGQ